MISRRHLVAGGLAAGFLSACTTPADKSSLVDVDGPEVRAAEAARNPGRIIQNRLHAAVSQVDFAGTATTAWCYNGKLPGPVIRATAGEQVKLILANQLPAETSIHWHGLALRNDADGVPHITQQPIMAGAEYTYQFTASHPGTYWFHPHTGTQLDRGLYAPLIIDDPSEPLAYDDEWIVVLDDWTGTDPDTILAGLRKGMDHGAGMPMSTSVLLGGDAGDVPYEAFLLNGRPPADPEVYQGKPGMRVRIRVINAASDTAFRLAIGGHRMRVTHTDGFAVDPIDTDALLIGMGERYDVLVTLGDGAFPLIAVAEGKNGAAFAVIRTGPGAAPAPSVRPPELDRRIIAYRQLQAAESVRLGSKPPDQTVRLELTGGMMRYDWGFNGKAFDHATARERAVPVTAGERIKLEFVNTTTMFHPVHLHGHTFAVDTVNGPRKDTAIVLPGQTINAIFDANNPGLWMIHCHNVYHAEAGMMTMIGYQRKG